MVAKPMQLVQPAQQCDCCQRVFHQGDKAVCVVKVPDGGYDTICIEDWSIVLASSVIGLKGMGTLDQKRLRALFLEALAVFMDQYDPEDTLKLNGLK